MPGKEIKGRSKIASYRHGGRAKKQLGGVGAVGTAGGVGGTARRDMRSGYYPNDMGMRGGAMYNKGGRVKANKGKLVGMRTEAQKKADEKLVADKKSERRKATPPVRLHQPYKKTRS
jgi:hypothetical protein